MTELIAWTIAGVAAAITLTGIWIVLVIEHGEKNR